MADEPEDVLELDSDLELSIEDDENQQDEDGIEGEGGEAEEADYAFADDQEGAAPAPQDSSVIRDLRRANRELARKLQEHERAAKPQVVEVGPEPTLADSFDEHGNAYCEETYKKRLLAWNAEVERANAQVTEAENKRKAAETEWQGLIDTYQASKASVPGAEDAEEVVEAALGDSHMRLLMLDPENAPKLMVALAKSPEKLETLAKLDLARAAMMIGKLSGTVQMTTRKTASPERRVTGNAGFAGGTDKQIEKLEREAERTGDRTKLIQYRRKLRERA